MRDLRGADRAARRRAAALDRGAGQSWSSGGVQRVGGAGPQGVPEVLPEIVITARRRVTLAPPDTVIRRSACLTVEDVLTDGVAALDGGGEVAGRRGAVGP